MANMDISNAAVVFENKFVSLVMNKSDLIGSTKVACYSMYLKPASEHHQTHLVARTGIFKVVDYMLKDADKNEMATITMRTNLADATVTGYAWEMHAGPLRELFHLIPAEADEKDYKLVSNWHINIDVCRWLVRENAGWVERRLVCCFMLFFV
jgi:hypothetical protein